MAFFEEAGDGFGGGDDERKVGGAVLLERSGDADEYGIDLGKPRKVGSEIGHAAGLGLADVVGGDVGDVGDAVVEFLHLGFVDVEADDAEAALLREGEAERQADIAEADDAEGSVAGFEALDKIGFQAMSPKAK